MMDGWSDIFLYILCVYIVIFIVLGFIVGICYLYDKFRQCCCGEQNVAYRKVDAQSDDDDILEKVNYHYMLLIATSTQNVLATTTPRSSQESGTHFPQLVKILFLR